MMFLVPLRCPVLDVVLRSILTGPQQIYPVFFR
ncbi:hypothetical protein Psta_0332 [Pirellula staleyi DSM 6068]|uniref:Uncharacterized protein n=1 Tax=Pirellula staleyi (strain ATCC 27377 / DSM 6068 / ICPB 4128) TaxID=530564 RepID=D2R2B3_PIRSD|nr:hypothetical protein Psta_0332 [Pirellula staleyi DSM 6068]